MTYNLVVQATDGTTPDTETITIMVTDVAPDRNRHDRYNIRGRVRQRLYRRRRQHRRRRQRHMVHHDQRGNADEDAPRRSRSTPAPASSPWPTRATLTMKRQPATTSSCRPQTPTRPTPRRSTSVTDVGLTVTDTSANGIRDRVQRSASIVDVDNTGDDDIAGLTLVHHDQPATTTAPRRSPSTPSTGVITLADSDDIDFETTVTYNLVVQVSDGGARPTPRRSPSR